MTDRPAPPAPLSLPAFDMDPMDEGRTTAGQVTAGRIDGRRIVLDCSITKTDLDGLSLALLRPDGSADLISLPYAPHSTGPLQLAAAFDPGPVVTAILPLARRGGRYERLATAEGYALDRLLSRTEGEATRNLRWQKRIPDLDTRAFAARNTVAGNPGDLPILCRAVVSVGYSAIERQRDDILDWADRLTLTHWDRIAAEGTAQLRASMAIFAMHLAIMRGDGDRLSAIALQVPDLLEGMEATPTGAANGLACLLLGGGFLLATGWRAAARGLFDGYDLQFRIANDGFPRSLTTMRELVVVAQRAELCLLGWHSTRPRTLPANTAPLTLNQAWKGATRLWDRGARERLGARLEVLARRTP